ncbi:MAG: type II toxin-antitoxin system prevent-host-death family antitoxin [Gemmatimonadaceae bacterium]|nr:type II toxin-antitoxin system prevent-host-death family antitoxin [Gemmatimonadaceae bacterium]
MTVWTLEHAKNQLSEVVCRALGQGPQEVQCGSRDSVVVISKAHYEQLIRPENLTVFLRKSPLARAVADGTVSIVPRTGRARDISF